jgi:hypothetical protein
MFMFPNLRFFSLLFGLLCIAILSMTNSSSAVTADVAKKCDALVAKAFPPREVGNPAAGSAKGTPQTVQDYFKKCLANGGKVDDQTKEQK